jgi:hypothetical protein
VRACSSPGWRAPCACASREAPARRSRPPYLPRPRTSRLPRLTASRAPGAGRASGLSRPARFPRTLDRRRSGAEARPRGDETRARDVRTGVSDRTGYYTFEKHNFSCVRVVFVTTRVVRLERA